MILGGSGTCVLFRWYFEAAGFLFGRDEVSMFLGEEGRERWLRRAGTIKDRE